MSPSKKKLYFGIIAMVLFIVVISLALFVLGPSGNTPILEKSQVFNEVKYPTPNFDQEKTNEILGVILHHTAEPSIENALNILSSPEKKVGTHVVIDTDGTRYVMADPSVVTYHAGYSVLDGRDSCNYFTIGIEFQGNTLNSPLTDEQIASGIEYLIPLIEKYRIPLESIVTHQMVRNAYKQKYTNKRCSGKVDITQAEYQRFMENLRKALTDGHKTIPQ